MSNNLELMEQAKKNICGGANSMMRVPSYHIPLVIKHARGVNVHDVEGNKLIDMNMGYGPLIFGHAAPLVVNAIKEELSNKGSVLGFVHELSSEVAKLIKQAYPSIDLMRFSSSGTEVDQTAVRLARAYTQRKNVVLFEGHYHGSSDSLFHNYHGEMADLENKIISGTKGMNGAPHHAFRVPWNDIEVLEKLFKEKGDTIAAVIMEPVMGNAGVIPPKQGYLQKVRDLTNAYNTVLIFDEIITGFRVAYGGAQERYDVEADITTFSKAINGGVPLSAIGGKADIMNLLTTGEVFHGGVYSGNPMSLAAAKAVQLAYQKNSIEIYSQLEKNTQLLKSGLIEIFSQRNIQIVVQAVGAMLSFAFVDSPDITCFNDYRDIKLHANHDKYIRFQNRLQQNGVYIHPNHYEPCFISTLHTKDVMDEVLARVEETAKTI